MLRETTSRGLCGLVCPSRAVPYPSQQIKNSDPFEPYAQNLYGKRSFSVTIPCPRPTRVNTKRLAERKMLLYRLGSELNRTV
jgi:hypothetical protein